MCGIFGFVTTGNRSLDDVDLDAAVRALRHRGPDDAGVWRHRAPDLQVGLAMTRLAVVDLSPAGRQPMTSDDGNVTLVYNGEVYDVGPLRREIESAGHRFRGRSDTEVILRGYEAWGSAVVHRLRGMFAFAVWDARRRTLFLARDRLGVKPLYLSHGPGWLAFSSEVRALVHARVVGASVRPEGLQTYLAFGSVAEPYTIFFHVEPHPPAHFSEWSGGNLVTRRYWDLPLPDLAPVSSADAAERVGAALREAVAVRLEADVPLGLFLSGGVDSTALLAAAHRARPGSIRTITLSFAERQWDEGPLAAETSRSFGAHHQDVRLGPDEALRLVPQALAAQDQPSLDGPNTFLVSRAARTAGLTVALSGVGGDELFVGYRRFADFERLLRLPGRTLPLARLLSERLAAAAGAAAAPWLLRKVLWVGTALHDPRLLYAGLRSVFLPDRVEELMTPGSVRLPLFPPADVSPAGWAAVGGPHPADPVRLFTDLELSNYLRNTLLRDTDVMSMAHGLEVREPLLDHRLVETVLPLPASLKRDGRRKKPLLVDASADSAVRAAARRPKRGFELPFDRWLRAELRPMAEANIEAAVRHSDGLLEPAVVRSVWRAWLDRNPTIRWFHPHALSNLGAWWTALRTAP